jgi:hypothetical protein
MIFAPAEITRDVRQQKTHRGHSYGGENRLIDRSSA